MRRIQIYMEEELDEALQTEAAKSGRSKAALIRECVADRYQGPVAVEKDPLTALVGAVEAEPADVDDVVYGR
ncbi:MAG: CopG family transcriptional regulator [bacterium]|nr:CopG family transcriptional regulator [bacterium]